MSSPDIGEMIACTANHRPLISTNTWASRRALDPANSWRSGVRSAEREDAVVAAEALADSARQASDSSIDR